MIVIHKIAEYNNKKKSKFNDKCNDKLKTNDNSIKYGKYIAFYKNNVRFENLIGNCTSNANLNFKNGYLKIDDNEDIKYLLGVSINGCQCHKLGKRVDIAVL